ncbi:MAG: glutathionylspermidine synthase family protein [Deltaproteobacteria bacterium]|nr:glutathionylspermidine synthase family protein [Deltaproteobacteria bacterium]
MKRLEVPVREGWQERFDEMGFSFHSMDGLYWREGVCYEFTSGEIDYLDDVTLTLHEMCLEAVDYVLRKNLLSRLRIPAAWEESIRGSWARRDPSLYGRFDLVHDNEGEAKLIEYNADTPTSLFESSIAQWIWLRDLYPACDQFNSIHEKLLAGLVGLKSGMAAGSAMHFACVREHEEDLVTVEYMRDVALQAGIDARHVFVEDIGYSAREGGFFDLDNRPIDCLFKLYPWEWLAADEFGTHLLADPIRMILEPSWKMVLSNKGILAILWEMFPGHPNLLAASLSPLDGVARSVRKPLFSREGANISVFAGADLIQETGGSYGEEGYVFQEYRELPRFGENYTLIGSWIVDNRPAGIGIREDTTPVTKNSSTFVPHFFRP